MEVKFNKRGVWYRWVLFDDGIEIAASDWKYSCIAEARDWFYNDNPELVGKVRFSFA